MADPQSPPDDLPATDSKSNYKAEQTNNAHPSQSHQTDYQPPSLMAKDRTHPLYRLRHSLAHVLAQAVCQIRDKPRLGYGPPTENGFFYDFEVSPPLKEEEFPLLEKHMHRIINEDQAFHQTSLPSQQLISQLEDQNQPYKVEMAKELLAEGNQTLSVYKNGPFADMCDGPHVSSTMKLPADAFKLDFLAGAYWKGQQGNPMLQRVHGLAFATKKELSTFLQQRELAKQRDHRKLGQQLQLFTISDEVGKGLPLWTPHGATICAELEKLASEMEFQADYQRVSTPHITKEQLYHTSGHLPYYKDSMFPPMTAENETFYLKPMNCPHHHMIYKSQPRSYRDLPLRLAEYGMCYRYEQSGELSGLLRVRALNINDAHIYCTLDQIKQELIDVMQMHLDYYRLFGITRYWMRLSLPDLDKTKYAGSKDTWLKANKLIETALQELGQPFHTEIGEAAFYGPKIDFQIANVVGREETASTNQLDLIMAENFGLEYVGHDNQLHRPHIIHRAPLGSHERFIAFLIEHYGGAFPTWLAPIQAIILPVSPKLHLQYSEKLHQMMKKQFIRTQILYNNESLGKRVRYAQTQKIPNIIIIGDQEQQDSSISWRRHAQTDQITLSLDIFLKKILNEINSRLDWRN